MITTFNFSVLYTERCALKIKQFDSYEKVKLFVGEFTLLHLNNTDDNCIDAIFNGAPIEVGPNVSMILLEYPADFVE